MVADVYSHIIDEDRRVNAQRFEEQFYQGKEGSQNDCPFSLQIYMAKKLSDDIIRMSERLIHKP